MQRFINLLLCLTLLVSGLPAPRPKMAPLSITVVKAQTAPKRVDLVFVVDTSGSMDEEFTTLCDTIDDLVSDLRAKGIEVRSRLLGITEPRACLQEFVTETIPGAISDHFEDWGPAVRDIAAGYDWLPGYTRLIIPMSDEAPEDGGDNLLDLGGGVCEDPGSDRDAITVAIDAAQANSVRVAPILGIGMGQCTITLAEDLARATGGQVFFTTMPRQDLAEGIARLIEAVAQDRDGDGIPDDEDPFPDDPCKPDPQRVCLPPQVCGISNTPHWDDDRDGFTDEEIQDGADNDGDGLIDEDVGGVNCPFPKQDCGVNSHRGLDDDADGRVDEELDNNVDDDGDHFIDEDVSCACPAPQDLGVNNTPGVDDDLDFIADEELDDGLDNDGDGCVDEDVASTPPNMLTVEILAPRAGSEHYFGGEMAVRVAVTWGKLPVLDAIVSGTIVLADGAPLSFSLRDNGQYGDNTPHDGVYSADVPLPGPSLLPNGEYSLQIQATSEQPNGKTLEGTAALPFKIVGQALGAPEVSFAVQAPGEVAIGDEVRLEAELTFPDGLLYPTTRVVVNVFRPDGQLEGVVLTRQGVNRWVGSYTLTQAGHYRFDARAMPPPGTGFVAGYAFQELDVLYTHIPLTVSPIGLPGIFAINEFVPLKVEIKVGDIPVANALVSARIGRKGTLLNLVSLGDGTYTATWLPRPEEVGEQQIEFVAIAPFYKAGQTSTTLTVEAGKYATLEKNLSDYANATHRQLRRLDRLAKRVAEDGDYFFSEVRTAGRELLLTVAFDLLPLWGAAFKGTGPQRAIFRSMRQVDAFVKTRLPGARPLLLIVSPDAVDGRAFKSWATRLGSRLAMLIERGPQSGWNRYLGVHVLGRAATYFAGQFSHKTMEDVTKENVKGWLGSLLGSNSQPTLQQELYPIFQSGVEQDLSVLETTQGSVVQSLRTRSLQPDWQVQVIEDLYARERAQEFLVKEGERLNQPLFQAAEKRRQNNTLWRVITKGLIEGAVVLTLATVLDGPGWAVLALKVGLPIVWHTYEAYRDLDEAARMVNFAFQNLLRIWDAEQQIFTNSLSGVYRVKYYPNQDSQRPEGRIIPLQDISRGEKILLFFSEKEAVARLRIENTGRYPAYFHVAALYNVGEQAHVLKTMRDPTSGEGIEFVELAPGASQEIEVVFKGANGHDMRPTDGSPIHYVLLGTTEDGVYLTGEASDIFDPTQEIVAQVPASVGRGPGRASMVQLQTGSAPVLPAFLTSRVATRPGTLSYTIFLTARNPLPQPIAATVRQRLPKAIHVVDAGEGTVESDMIRWHRVIQPHEQVVLAYEVLPVGAPGTPMEIPPAELSFYSAAYNTTATFTDFPLVVTPKVPLVAWATQLPEGADAVTVEVQNLAADAEEGRLLLTLLDLDGSEISTHSMAVRVAGGSTQTLSIPIPRASRSVVGPFGLLMGSLEYRGVTQEFFAETYTLSTQKPGVAPPIGPSSRTRGAVLPVLPIMFFAGLALVFFALYLSQTSAQGFPGIPATGSRRRFPPRPSVRAFILVTGPAGSRRYPLTSLVTRLGRARDNDIVIENPYVSAHHAEIREIGGRFVLFDLQSTNGTYVNGQRVSQHWLRPGDEIRIGQVTLRFQLNQ